VRRSVGLAAAASLMVAAPASAQQTVAAGSAAPRVVTATCAAPGLVSSSATDVAAGVHDPQRIVYTAVVDDPCLATSPGGVTVEVFKDGVGYADRSATYTGLQGGYQVWQATFTVDPLHSSASDLPLLTNDFAGIWGSIVRIAGSTANTDLAGDTLLLRRFSRIESTNATEPTPKGATETVTGKLARANWSDNQYHGNAYQPVSLQFRTLTGSYASVKTVTSDSTGQLRTTTTATVDGCYRWSFAGNDETPPATAAGDCVDVT
jgi:hypothetical protein